MRHGVASLTITAHASLANAQGVLAEGYGNAEIAHCLKLDVASEACKSVDEERAKLTLDLEELRTLCKPADDGRRTCAGQLLR